MKRDCSLKCVAALAMILAFGSQATADDVFELTRDLPKGNPIPAASPKSVPANPFTQPRLESGEKLQPVPSAKLPRQEGAPSKENSKHQRNPSVADVAAIYLNVPPADLPRVLPAKTKEPLPEPTGPANPFVREPSEFQPAALATLATGSELEGLDAALAISQQAANEANAEVELLQAFVEQQPFEGPFIDDPISEPLEAIVAPPASVPATVASRGFNERRAPRLLSIHQASVDITPLEQAIDNELSSTELPRNMAYERFGGYQQAAIGGNEFVRHAPTYCLWRTPGARHKPLYFEQPNLERYGTHLGGDCCASVMATGCFVGSALSLPYQMATTPPSECVYTLGNYRPGNCNPHFVHLSRPSLKGLAAQGAAVSGLVFLFP